GARDPPRETRPPPRAGPSRKSPRWEGPGSRVRPGGFFVARTAAEDVHASPTPTALPTGEAARLAASRGERPCCGRGAARPRRPPRPVGGNALRPGRPAPSPRLPPPPGRPPP